MCIVANSGAFLSADFKPIVHLRLSMNWLNVRWTVCSMLLKDIVACDYCIVEFIRWSTNSIGAVFRINSAWLILFREIHSILESLIHLRFYSIYSSTSTSNVFYASPIVQRHFARLAQQICCKAIKIAKCPIDINCNATSQKYIHGSLFNFCFEQK